MAASDDLLEGIHELDEAREDYDEAWDYWEGEVPESFGSLAVQRALAKSTGEYGLNIAKIPVVALADRLKITSIVALGETGEKDDAADLILQDKIVTPNRLPLQFKRLTRNTLIFGDSYLFVWPGDTEGSVTVAYNDPRVTRAVYDDDDELLMKFGVKRAHRRGQITASMLYADHLERGWLFKEGAGDGTKAWVRGPDFVEYENTYGRVPIFHFRTDLPYGTPEHRDVFGAQNAVQKFASTMVYAGERAGLRDRYLLTDPNASLNGNSGDSPDWEDEGDADQTSADNSRVRSGAGDIAVLEGIKAAGEWSAADPVGFMDPSDFFTRYAMLSSRTPGRYSDPGGQHPSGSALRVADAPLASKTDDRQEYIDGDVKEAMVFALSILGLPDRQVDVRWKPPGIVDDVDTWQIARAKIDVGVPVRVALVETGLYEADTVNDWMTDAQVEMDVARRIDLLAAFSASVAQLGQGVALGLLDEAQAKSVVDAVVGQLAPQVEGDVPA